MNENQNSNELNQNRENEPAITQPGGNGNQGEKLFTQEEVNKIVSDRLNKERQRTVQRQNENALDARESELSARENLLTCRDFIDENKYNPKLLELFNTLDAEAFKESINKLFELFPSLLNAPADMAPMGNFETQSDALASVFKPPKI